MRSTLKNQSPGKGRDNRKTHIRNSREEPDQINEERGKGHGPLKGTDTPATTDLEYAEREKGKRTTM